MILLILYIIGALLIGLYSMDTLWSYLTILPIQFFLMRGAWKSKNVILSLFFTYFFIAIGIGTVMLYLDRGSISNVGTNHVGNFDFSISYLFAIYSYLLFFQLVVYVAVRMLTKSNSLPLMMGFVKNETTTLLTRGKGVSIIPLLITAVVFASISIWMYSRGIGLIGLKQVQLPYHMAGILYYSRRFLFTIILIWLFLKTKDRKMAVAILIFYSLIVAVTGSSKSINLILLVPVGVICWMSNNKVWGIISFVASLLIYTYVTCTREIVYAVDADIALSEVIFSANLIFWNVVSNDISYITRLVAGVCESMYGMKNVVVAYQYNSIDLSDFISYYIGNHMSSFIKDMPYELYGVTYSADKAYGVCVGFPGTMVMMSSRIFVLLTIEAIIISIVFCIQNRILSEVFRFKSKRLYKYALLLIFLFSMMMLIEANSLMPVYLSCVLMWVIKNTAKNYSNKTISHNAKIATN